MVLFPPCKINIGLDILAERADGYHDIDTVMAPVHGLCDSLEIVGGASGDTSPAFSFSGIKVDCEAKDNIIAKAWKLMAELYGIGPVKAHLHKAIPFGAGLGGGSSDAAFMLRGLNILFSLGLNDATLSSLAAQLGSDVPFFIYDTSLQCTGKGDIMYPADISLEGFWLTIVKPPVCVSTAEAYAGTVPSIPAVSLRERLCCPIEEWKHTVKNAFEESLFCHYPELSEIKQSLYRAGAVYASLSGSGSALYGIFHSEPQYTTCQGIDAWIVQL